MSVIPMKKVRFVVHANDADQMLTILQRAGVLELLEVSDITETGVAVVAPHHQLFPRVQHAIAFLDPFAPQKTLWRTLREGTQTELSETELIKQMSDTDALESIVSDLEQLQVELAESEAKVQRLEANHALLTEWKDLPIRLVDLKTAQTKTFLVRQSDARSLPIADTLAEGLTEYNVSYALTTLDESRAAVTVSSFGFADYDIQKMIESFGGEISEVPTGKETPEIEITAAADALAQAKGERGLLYDQAEHFAQTHINSLHIAGEVLGWERDRYAAIENGGSTAKTVVLDGWLNANAETAVLATITEQKLAAVMQEIAPEPDEEPPVDIQNNAWVQPFEVVTRLYGMPGHTDLDPTLFLAGFFFLFFGLSLTDVGYGLTLMVVAVAILTLFKVAPVVRTFAKLLLFMGLGSFLVGLLFGGYLGIAPESLPPALQAIAIFDPIGNPLPVFYLALGLGVFQVMVGMVLKIYSEARNQRLVSGILDQGPWLFVFFVAIAYLAVVTGYLDGVTEAQLINLIYVGLVMVVLASGRKGKTVLEKVQKAALSLYDSIGYFSDILSYSRLLALGLATTALAFAVNLIAEIVSGSVPYLGPVLAIVVLVIGHLFTLAVNTLGAFIHSARLQFVEFFGKFIAGTGREFKPLRRTYRYIAMKDE